jgi:hypothetical protein
MYAARAMRKWVGRDVSACVNEGSLQKVCVMTVTSAASQAWESAWRIVSPYSMCSPRMRPDQPNTTS